MRRARFVWLLVVTCLTCGGGMLGAAETPSSSGPAARVDTPVWRIPLTQNPPTIDGTMKEGEWQDASALSSFWYDYAQADFRYLAPEETQLEVYGAYDKENLYIAYVSPVYPPGSWLKARGRFPDVHHHPQYGVIWDDHIELEIRPYHDNVKGFRLGLYKWFINPIGTVADSYWSQQDGFGSRWQSGIKARSEVTETKWTLELAVPLDQMVQGNYAGTDREGEQYVTLPPPPGTAYRVWFTRGIGGNGQFYNAFDAHVWNTTKTKMILDPDSVSFQVNELGPIMEDIVNLNLTVKNHSSQSKTLRIGFFVESAAGNIYSSYNDEELNEGLLELVPGEVRELQLKKPFPGISQGGNVLWFDVRTAGRPAQPVFRTRLVDFHSQDFPEFKERRIDVIDELRPPRKDFEVRTNYSEYSRRLSTIVDIGIHGASEEARGAREARISLLDQDAGDKQVLSERTEFQGKFAGLLMDVPQLQKGHTYSVSVLLFDKYKRIVGEDSTEEFTVGDAHNAGEKLIEKNPDWNNSNLTPVPIEEWKGNDLGTGDVVWEPFVPMEVDEEGFETLKHRFTLADSGLPAQIHVKPHRRNLPLEKRQADAQLSAGELREIGRGPQLRGPMRLEVIAGGKRHRASVTREAQLVREWKSELVYESELEAGPLELKLRTRYDCDGSMHTELTYGSDEPVEVEGFELLTDIAGQVDMVASAIHGGGMAGADRWECTLPHSEGVVWDSANLGHPEMYYTHFVPFIFFGSGDRGFTWYAGSDRHWKLNRSGSSMTLERNADMEVTWRVKFVNHATEIEGRDTLKFHVLTHPAKAKPENFREIAWLYRGDTWARGYQIEPVEVSENYLKRDWRRASLAPDDLPHEKADTWRKESAPWPRYGRWRNVGISAEMDQFFEDKAVYYLERQIRVGRRVGYWWDEYWSPGFGRSNNLAAGNAYLRDPQDVGEKELPYQSAYLTEYMRRTQKRLARVFATNNVPQRQYHWANSAATAYESFAWDTQLVEECGSSPRSFNIDIVTQFPNSLWRYEAHNFTGLVARVVPQDGQAKIVFSRPGDDERMDRQFLGRALLNDIGVCYDGPHGTFQNNEEAVRLLSELRRFGYFEDRNIEYIPYWRSEHLVRYGNGRRTDAHLGDLGDLEPSDSVYVSVFRRPIEQEGRRGYKVLFVIMNEHDEPVSANLRILDPERLFGAQNNLRLKDVVAGYELPEGAAGDLLADWMEEGDGRVLEDLESGGFVGARSGEDHAYGPVWIPHHNYRVLYGHYVIAE